MKLRRTELASYALVLVSILLAAAGQALMKAGVGAAEGHEAAGVLSTAVRSPQVVGGVLAYGLSSVIWLVVLSRMRLSVAYPLAAFSYVLVVATGAVLGEHVSAVRWLGVALVVAGVVLVGAPDLLGRGRGPSDGG